MCGDLIIPSIANRFFFFFLIRSVGLHCGFTHQLLKGSSLVLLIFYTQRYSSDHGAQFLSLMSSGTLDVLLSQVRFFDFFFFLELLKIFLFVPHVHKRKKYLWERKCKSMPEGGILMQTVNNFHIASRVRSMPLWLTQIMWPLLWTQVSFIVSVIWFSDF